MEDPKKQLIDRLKQAQNVLVTVSKDPSVDQLAAAIGLTVALNNMDKHATAVFSGKVPSTLEFLKPEETLEATTDSLRDFIIALDKSKADKLRYKVEDDVVRIFITPYKTSVSQADLEFSQGDFNVDVVVALGVQNPQDLDDAIQAHGRILHDALVASVTVDGPSELGTLNVVGTDVSSLSELVAGMAEELNKQAIDAQSATAFLTGIVAVTDRFSNQHTTAETMTISATLMAAGANQQLISTELAAPPTEPVVDSTAPEADSELVEDEPKEEAKSDDGTLEIDHEHDAKEATQPEEKPEGGDEAAQSPVLTEDEGETNGFELPTPPPASETLVESPDDEDKAATTTSFSMPTDLTPAQANPAPAPQIAVDENGNIAPKPAETDLFMPHPVEADQSAINTRGRTIEPPTLGGTLTANVADEPLGKPYEEATQPAPVVNPPLLSHDAEALNPSDPPAVEPNLSVQSPLPPVATAADTLPQEPVASPLFPPNQLKHDLEKQVTSLAAPPEESADPTILSGSERLVDADEARKAVEAALNGAGTDAPLAPITALNAQPLGDPLHSAVPVLAPTQTELPTPAATPAPAFMPAPGFGAQPTSPSAMPGVPVTATEENDPNPPPPVPPPMIPPLPQ
jgi:hypothetical protein